MRVDNWPLILEQQIEAARARPHEWGTWDCCQFAGETVSALTGVDHRDAFPRYADEAEAQALLGGMGGLVELLSSVLGDPKPPAMAQRGDVVVADFGAGPAAGICIGANICAPGPRGLVFRPLTIATAAWSI